MLNFVNTGTITYLKLERTVLFRTALEDKNRLLKLVTLKAGAHVHIRLLVATDILSLHKMYRSLSEESKKFFRPTFFRRKSSRWLLANFALLISTIIPLKTLLVRLFPRIITIVAIIALNDENEIVAFAYLNIKQRLADGKYSAGFATCVRDDYQSRGLGSKLTKHVIELVRRKKVSEVFLWVSSKNVKAIGLYKKYGFKVAQLVRSSQFKGKSYDYLKMRLHLS